MRNTITLFLLTAFVTMSMAQDKRPMTPDDVAMLKSVSSAIISEDGNTIAYLQNKKNEDKNIFKL